MIRKAFIVMLTLTAVGAGVLWLDIRLRRDIVLASVMTGVLALTCRLAASLRARYDTRQRYRHGHCQKCGYDLTGNESGVCPECGMAIEAIEANP